MPLDESESEFVSQIITHTCLSAHKFIRMIRYCHRTNRKPIVSEKKMCAAKNIVFDTCIYEIHLHLKGGIVQMPLCLFASRIHTLNIN